MERTTSFGYWLRRRRKALDLTQEELASQVGCAVGTIKKLEGDDRRPSRQMAERLADLLQVPPDERAAFLKAARAELATDQLDIAAVPLDTAAQPLSTALPTGTVTFLFTDIADSTRLWSQHPDGMRAALARHDALLRTAIERHTGVVFKTVGDAFYAAFGTAADALAAAVAAQHALRREVWAELAGATIMVRVALHTGTAELRAGDYFGPTLNRIARILAAGHGGQILLSAATRELVADLPPDLALRDLGAHWLKGLPRPEPITQLLAPDLPADFPPLVTLSRPSTNLPAHMTAFIGRERETAAVRDLLRRSDVRLVTLTGPGGTGKTRLSQQIALDLLADFPDGTWFVNLATISDLDLVASTIAQALGLHDTGGQPVRERLNEYLRVKQMLLLLDNFEQIVDAAPLVGELLAVAPGLNILATSRIPLRLSGEREYAVPPLTFPDRTQPLEWTRLAQYDAVRLFIERAQAVKADFAVTNANAPAVAEICSKLDGLPLAIELAAARVKLFAPQALLARLDRRLAFLTGGARDLPERQQTIRNTIDWSYNLLDAGEQELFARLAVFADGCSLEAAEAICNANRDLLIGVVDGIAALVDKSLVRQNTVDDGEPRFVMLETIREYALERLMASDQADELRERHAGYYLVLAETTEPELHRAEQVAWLQQLEQEHDNFRAALTWSQATAVRVEIGLRIAGALGWFWQRRGYWTEGYSWLVGLLEYPMTVPSVGRSRALNLAGRLIDNRSKAQAYLEESLAIAQVLGDKTCMADALGDLGWPFGSIAQSNPERARALLEASLALCRELDDTWRTAMTLCGLGLLAEVQGDREQALAPCTESLALFRQLGDHWGIAFVLRMLSSLKGDPDENEPDKHIEESLALWRQLGDTHLCASTLNDLGESARARAEYERSTTHFAESLALFRELGDRQGMAMVLENLGFVHLRQGDVVPATACFREALAAARGSETKDLCLFGLALTGSAAVANVRAQPERAARLLGAADALFSAATTPLASTDRADYEHIVADVHAALDEAAFATRWAEGQALTLEQVIAESLGED